MKNALSIFGNFILVLIAVTCTVGAVISAFSFDVNTTVLFIAWLSAALVAAFGFAFLRARGLLIFLAIAIFLMIWRLPIILEGARWVLFYITHLYNRWLFVSVLFPEMEGYGYDVTLFFAALGVVLTFLLSVSICLRRSVSLTILFTAPIVFLTFVIIFNQADTLFLLGLLAVYLTMLVSNGLAPDGFLARGLSTFPALLLVAVFMSITLAFAPPGAQGRSDIVRTLDHDIRVIASRLGLARVRTGIGWPVIYDQRWGFNTDHVDISDAGTRVIHDIEVLEVVVSAPGIFYLRGYSMQYFDGNTWTVNSETLEIAYRDFFAQSGPALITGFYRNRFPDTAPEFLHMTVYVTGDATRNVIYSPYFTFPFNHNTSPYSFDFFHVGENIFALHNSLSPRELSTINLTDFNAMVSSRDTYLQIADSTAQALRHFAEDNQIYRSGASRLEITNQVASFMTNFGRYTLAPFSIPPEEDFVMYFLETSQQGFCIHYATAATMMLRALDVPARFTSGFVATVTPEDVNTPIAITDRYAHAWVEVFFDNIGWIPIEATPAATGFGFGTGLPAPGTLLPQLPLPSDGFDLFDDYADPFFADWWGDTESSNDFTPAQGTTQQVADPLAGGALAFRIIWIAVLAAVIVAAPFVFRALMLKHRAKQFALSDLDASVIFAWRYLLRLMRFRRTEVIADGIEDIAMKARYSQHSISEDERSAVITYVTRFAEKVYVYSRPLMRFWIKYIRGL